MVLKPRRRASNWVRRRPSNTSWARQRTYSWRLALVTSWQGWPWGSNSRQSISASSIARSCLCRGGASSQGDDRGRKREGAPTGVGLPGVEGLELMEVGLDGVDAVFAVVRPKR